MVRPETNMAAAAKILLDMKVSAALQCLGARSSIQPLKYSAKHQQGAPPELS